jgi:hypothetical protein
MRGAIVGVPSLNALVRKAGLFHHEGQEAHKEQFEVETCVNTSSAIGTT